MADGAGKPEDDKNLDRKSSLERFPFMNEHDDVPLAHDDHALAPPRK